MSSSERTLVVFGSGPGIGQAVAYHFASQGFQHLVLLSRNPERLQEDRRAVLDTTKGREVRVDTVTIDLSSESSVHNALAQIDNLVRNVEVVLYNGARVAQTPLFKTTSDEILKDFKTTTIGLYLVSQWAIPKLQARAGDSPGSKPSLIVTSGFLHREPMPALFSLSLVKTAQRNLVQSLHMVFNNGGVHIGLVLVGGIVSPDAKVLNPRNIANVTWDFYDNEANQGKLEVDMVEA